MKHKMSAILVCFLFLCGCASAGSAGETGSISTGPDGSVVRGDSSAEAAPVSVDYDYAALYSQVLEDLWNTDPGLNGDIRYISLDLSEAPGDLTQEEISSIAETFAASHQAEPLTLTRQELQDQGYLSMDENGMATGWEDGVLFSIGAASGHGGEGCFDAKKWRSLIGGDYWYNCTAVWSESGAFLSYQVGAEAIS